MKRLLAATTALWIGVFLAGNASAQDIHFSQFYDNAIMRNPALTGIFSGDYKAGVNYRTQWGNVANPFQTSLASVESRIAVGNNEANDYLSFGLAVTYDHAGSIDFNSLQVCPAINYNKAIEDKHQSYFSVGFVGAYVQRSIDASKMTVDNQYVGGNFDPNIGTNEKIGTQSFSHLDVGAGVSFNSSIGQNNEINYYIGSAAYHITRPTETFYSGSEIKLSTRWSENFGFHYRIDNQFGATFHFNYENQNPYHETIFGGMGSWRNSNFKIADGYMVFNVGAFYRVGDAIIPTVKVEYNNYSFTMSYDVTTSSLQPASSGEGGFEMSIFVRGKLHKGIFAKDKLKCPRFEEVGPSSIEQ